MVQLPLCFKASATQSGTTTGTFGLNGPYCIERVSLPSLSLSLSLSLALSLSLFFSLTLFWNLTSAVTS